MTEPANHTLIVTDHAGNAIRGKVVYLQPKAERWRPQSATVHIVTSAWLDSDRYQATYHTPQMTVHGHYVVLNYARTDDERWLFKGSFDADAIVNSALN